jgi:hypothetical protein
VADHGRRDPALGRGRSAAIAGGGIRLAIMRGANIARIFGTFPHSAASLSPIGNLPGLTAFRGGVSSFSNTSFASSAPMWRRPENSVAGWSPGGLGESWEGGVNCDLTAQCPGANSFGTRRGPVSHFDLATSASPIMDWVAKPTTQAITRAGDCQGAVSCPHAGTEPTSIPLRWPVHVLRAGLGLES